MVESPPKKKKEKLLTTTIINELGWKKPFNNWAASDLLVITVLS